MNECMVQSAPLRDRGPARALHRMWCPLIAETCSMRTSRSNVAGPVVAPPEAPGLSTRKCEWRSTSVLVPFMAANTSICSKVIKLGKSWNHTSEQQRRQHPCTTLAVGSQRRTSTEHPQFNDLFSCIQIHLQIRNCNLTVSSERKSILSNLDQKNCVRSEIEVSQHLLEYWGKPRKCTPCWVGLEAFKYILTGSIVACKNRPAFL